MRALVSLLIILCFSVHCSKRQDQSVSERVELAYSYIDQNKPEKAIALLEGSDPEDERVQLALASAYAHRGGISVGSFLLVAENLWGAPELDRQRAEERYLEVLKYLKSQNSSPELIELVGTFYRSVGGVIAWERRFSSLPDINAEGADNLKQAISQLDLLKTIKPSTALYRGFLRLVLFKYRLFNDGYIRRDVCWMTAVQFVVALETMVEDLITMMRDFQLGLPKHLEAVAKALVDLQKGQVELRKAVYQGLDAMDGRFLLMLWTAESILDEFVPKDKACR